MAMKSLSAEDLFTVRGIATVPLLNSFIPTHRLPLSVVGRAQKWTLAHTLSLIGRGTKVRCLLPFEHLMPVRQKESFLTCKNKYSCPLFLNDNRCNRSTKWHCDVLSTLDMATNSLSAEDLSALAGIATISFLHSFIPTHWIPFSVVGKAQKWTLSQTLLVTAFAAVCHVFSTTLLGLVTITMATSIAGEETVHWLASVLLVLLGFSYILLFISGKGYHIHNHNQSMEKMAVGGLILVPTLSPCATTLPAFLAVGSSSSSLLLLAIVVILCSTMTVMLTLVALSFYGVGQLKFHWVERYDKALMGAVLCLVGVLTHIFHHHDIGRLSL